MDDSKSLFLFKELKKNLSDNIIKVILFGSHARGDNSEGSDYDFLIIVKNKNYEVIDKIHDIEVDFLNKFYVLSSAIILNENEWERTKYLPLGLNIQKEGIEINEITGNK